MTRKVLLDGGIKCAVEFNCVLWGKDDFGDELAGSGVGPDEGKLNHDRVIRNGDLGSIRKRRLRVSGHGDGNGTALSHSGLRSPA